jgi:bifunctional glutamyl/prolyl-tRNA synthetase
MEIVLTKGASSSLVCLAIVETVDDPSISVRFDSASSLKTEKGDVISGTFAIARYLTRVFPQYHLYGNNILEEAQVDHWLEYSVLQMSQLSADMLTELNGVLSTRTYLVGSVLTMADFAVYAQLNGALLWTRNCGDCPHLNRWFGLLGNHIPIRRAVGKVPSQQNEVQKEKRNEKKEEGGPRTTMEEGGKFIDLPGASEGNVVVRFPPEAGGYLHVGHAKAALLNQYYQLTWKGKLVMRFDDTNPEKEKEEFEKVILEDVDMLGIKPDIFTFTSDHFSTIMAHAEDLIKRGLAFVDDNPQEVMAKEREEKRPSNNRDRSFEQNWRLWQEMVKGSEAGQKCCLRAKMDPTNDNGCLRDPTMYRCKVAPHPRTGETYKVYPTYDFACPIVDSREGVTHALRTTEYHDRDPQYYWFIEKLGIRKPYVWEYSRLNLQNTVLSKRKLTWFVEQGLVDGW